MESSSDPMRDFAKNIDCQVDNLITVKMPREIIKVNEFFDKYKDMTFDQYKVRHPCMLCKQGGVAVIVIILFTEIP